MFATSGLKSVNTSAVRPVDVFGNDASATVKMKWCRKNSINKARPMTYNMNDGMRIAEQVAANITIWLRGKPETISVWNVEHEPPFQRRDIGLI